MKKKLTHEEALKIIEPFYRLFKADKRDWDKGMNVLADEWKGYSTNTEFRTKAETRPFLQGLFDLVPDINVEIKQIAVDDDIVAVRSELSGTPKGDFMVPYSGRSFRIMTIDFNRIRDGKIIELYHVEDWATAINQLSGKKA